MTSTNRGLSSRPTFSCYWFAIVPCIWIVANHKLVYQDLITDRLQSSDISLTLLTGVDVTWWPTCSLVSGCYDVCRRVKTSGYRRGPDRLVSGESKQRVLCCMSVPVLWPSAAWCYPGACMATQHHGLRHAVHDPGHERIHWQGGSAHDFYTV